MRFVVEVTKTTITPWLVDAENKDAALIRVQHRRGPATILTQLIENSEMKFEVKEDDFKFEKKR